MQNSYTTLVEQREITIQFYPHVDKHNTVVKSHTTLDDGLAGTISHIDTDNIFHAVERIQDHYSDAGYIVGGFTVNRGENRAGQDIFVATGLVSKVK